MTNLVGMSGAMSGGADWWSLVLPTSKSVFLAIVCGASIYGVLQFLERFPRRGWMGIAPLAAVFYCIGPITYLGDWSWIIELSDRFVPLPKWYGGSLAYGLFHHTAGRLLHLSAQESVRLFSSLCGAAVVYVWWRTARRLGATRKRFWPLFVPRRLTS